MSAPSLSLEAVFTALGDFLTAVLPAGTEVIRGQVNRVPMPASDNFAVMTEHTRQQLAQVVNAYDVNAGTETIARSTAIAVQVDVYGTRAADNAQVLTTLLRSRWGADFFAARPVAPLYCADPQQMPILAGEQQWIQRWMVLTTLHASPGVTVPAQFADALITTLTELP